MNKKYFLWGGGLLLTLSISEMLPITAIASEPEKPANFFHTTSGCRGHTLDNYLVISATSLEKANTDEDWQLEISACTNNGTSWGLSDYSDIEVVNEDDEKDINTKFSFDADFDSSIDDFLTPQGKMVAQFSNEQNQAQLNLGEPILPIPTDELPPLPLPEAQPEEQPEQPPPEQPPPEEEPELTTEQKRKLLRTLMRNLLDNSATRYPFMVNTSDKLIINPRNFQPAKFHFYANFSFDLDNLNPNNSDQTEKLSTALLKSGNISVYPDEQQFYWVLEGNRVVIETEGRHLNVAVQGTVSQPNRRQVAKVSTVFWGVQTVFGLPNNLQDLVGDKQLEDVNIIAGSGEILLPPGANLGENPSFTVNITRPDGNSFQKFIPWEDTGKASTNALQGGGAFFENLDATNTPRFLQAFPTVNLQPLLNNGVKLEVGSIIPLENLAAAGLTLGDFFTKRGFAFDSPISSRPGVKILRLDQTDNNDIVAILSNPFLSKEERDFHYLNSLMWYNLGQQNPEFATFDLPNQKKDWYRYTLSWSRNRSLLQYDPKKIKLNYVNVFSNPGLSITTAKWQDTDNHQTTNASLGLILGSAFNWINPVNLNETIREAKEKYQNLQPLASLNTQATSAQRRQMNQRLNDTLNYGNTNSNLDQVSGSYTFASNITPDSSLLLQLRTGLYRRGVQFIQQEIEPWTPETPVIIDIVRNSDLGPIFFTGVNVPTSLTGITAEERVQFTFVRGETSDGEVLFEQSYVFDNRLANLFTAVPIMGPGKTYDLNFGRIKLSRFRERNINTTSYSGSLYFPSVEVVASGSINNFSYSLSTGVWLNLFPDSAPMVERNLGNRIPNATHEVSLGGMFKFSAKADFRNTFYDEQKQWRTIIVNSPFFSVNYNTNPNSLNLANISLGNVFQFVRRDFNVTFYPVLSYSPKMLNPNVNSSSLGNVEAFFLMNFSHKSGWNVNSNISFQQETRYQIEATYNVIKNEKIGSLEIGPYIANFVRTFPGFDFRVAGNDYGIKLRYETPNSGVVVNSRIGNGLSGFRGELNLQLKLR
jgi:hypothetical protein